MGLDQYLYVNKHYSNFAHTIRNFGEDVNDPDKEAKTHDAVLTAMGATASPESLVGSFSMVEVKIQVGYWRKANAVHGWFVDNIAGGVDDCKPVDFPLAELDGLEASIRTVLDTTAGLLADTAKLELPVRRGFFFGSDAYDEYYVDDLKHTLNIIEFVRENYPDDYLTYRASW